MFRMTKLLVGVTCLSASVSVWANEDVGPWQGNISYVGDILSNVNGGMDTGTTYTGMLTLTVDWRQDLWSAHSNFYFPHGSSVTDRYVGDLAVVSNIDTPSDARMQELWFERALGEHSLRFGMLAADTEFWGSDYASLLINSEFGAPIGISGNLPNPAIFPTAAAGVRFAWHIDEGATARFALLDGDAEDVVDDNPHGFDADWGNGSLFLAEYELLESRGEENTPNRFRVGMYYHTGDWEFIDSDSSNSYGLTAGLDHAFSDNMGWFARATVSHHSTSLVPFGFETGLSFNQPWGLPGTLATGVGYLSLNDDLLAQLDIPDADYEMQLEATWDFPITDYLSLQPDIQYIVNPGGFDFADNAWVVGLRVKLDANLF
jgi:porin